MGLHIWLILLMFQSSIIVSAQVGSEQEPVRYIGDPKISNSDYKNGYHDGQMRVAIGVQNYQILRANRMHPEWSDNLGWTYNHAPMLAYWNGQFYSQYLNNPTGEHIAPGMTMLARSKDGKNWTKPQVLFPIYFIANDDASIVFKHMHQRMGFYVAPNGRLLTMAFYGANKGYGVGRVVREIYADDSLGPIYFIRLNDNWKGEVKFPLYNSSSDKEFVEACDAFLADKIRRVQWWEEDHLAKDAAEFYRVPWLVDGEEKEPGKAFCFYTRPDGAVIGFFKSRWVTMTKDLGENWSQPVRCTTITYEGAKVWAQKLDNGQYALVYNPTASLARHPLCIATSDDGILFDNLVNVHSEVPPKRFWGREKRPGAQYVRGIIEGNGNPPGDDLWVTYSVNKEDIWISRIPIPVKWKVEGPIQDDFNSIKPGGMIDDWNIYSPQWCPVEISEAPNSQEKCLMLKDFDPYDYAKAVRVIPKLNRSTISFQLYIEKNPEGLGIGIVSGNGARLVQLRCENDGTLLAKNGSAQSTKISDMPIQKWLNFELSVDVGKKSFTITLNDRVIAKNLMFSDQGHPERIVFRTGEYRLQDDVQEYKSGNDFIPGWDEPGADEPCEEAVFYIREFTAMPGQK